MATESVLVGFSVLGEQSRRGVRYWGPPLVGVVVYPELIDLFSRAVDSYRSSGNLLQAVDAASLILLALTGISASALTAFSLIEVP